MGRARALEVIIGSDDFDAETAERYGWINRCLPDHELDGFVDNLARRIASFDGPAIAEAKRLVNRTALPQPKEFLESQTAFLAAARWPQVLPRVMSRCAIWKLHAPPSREAGINPTHRKAAILLPTG
jgi:enoyl-CoA hydratase/carnithine racemase